IQLPVQDGLPEVVIRRGKSRLAKAAKGTERWCIGIYFHIGNKIHPGHAQASLKLINTGCSRFQIFVPQKSLSDELLQYLIPEQFPPWKIGYRRPFHFRHAKLFSNIDMRA